MLEVQWVLRSGPQGGRERGRGRGRVPQPTALRRGLRYVAPSELTYGGNFGYRTLAATSLRKHQAN